MQRRKMSRRASRRNYSKRAGTHRKNNHSAPVRGGYRL